MKNSTLNLTLLLISNVLFGILFLTLSWHNRLAFDDFHFLWSLNEYGILGTTMVEYNTWSTRWTAVTLIALILSFQEQTSLALFLFGILGLVVFISAIFLLIRTRVQGLDLFSSESDGKSVWATVNISVFIVSIVFIGTIKIDETWFLFVSSCVYLWSIIMLCVGTAWVFHPKKHLGLACIGTFSFIYIGGSLGPLSIIVLVLLCGALYLSRNHIPVKVPSRKDLQWRLILSILGCGIAFAVLYFGKGNRVRESFFDEISIGYALILNVKMTGIIILKRLPFVLPYIVVLCLPMIVVGSKLSKEDGGNWKAKLMWLTFAFFFIIYLYQLPITYKTQDVGAFRALFPISILTIVYISWLYLILGKNLVLSEKVKAGFLTLPLIFGITLFAYHGFEQGSTVGEYARSYDQRMEYLDEHGNQEATLELLPLAKSGMLFTAEISTDTAYFVNQHLKKGLGLSCSVKLKGDDKK